MKEQIEIEGQKYVLASSIREPAKKNTKGMEYCVVRTYSAGVFTGWYDRKTKGKEGTVFDARRIWYWEGAASLSQLANEGVKSPDKCKFAQPVAEVTLKEIIEVIPCTAKAKSNIEAVKNWEK